MTDRNVMVRLRANADQFNREMRRAREAVRGVRDEIDTSNDRTAWLTQGILALAPTFVPLGAAAVPVIAGIATGMVLAAGAVGVLALGFSGVGDALSALNKAQLEPTAENLAKVREEMQKLGPDGAEFVRFLDEAAEKFSVLQMDARAGMFPGMTEGIEEVLTLLPRLRVVVSEIAEGLGTLSADAGAGLAGPEFFEFFEYLQTDAQDTLVTMGRALGNFIDGFASMIVAFAPLTEDFSGGLLDMSRSFEEWAEGLQSSDTFEDFLEYVQESGPKAIDLFEALVDALVELTKAAAPIGDAILPLITGLFNAIASIADTPIGQFAILGAALTSLYGRMVALKTIAGGPIFTPFIKGMQGQAGAVRGATSQIGRDLGAMSFIMARTTAEQEKHNRATRNLGRNLGIVARGSAGVAAPILAIAAASGAMGDSIAQSNQALFAMIGAAGGPWGVAAGAIIGGFLDIKAASDRAADAVSSGDMDAALTEYEARMDRLSLTDPMNWLTGEGVRAGIEDLYSLGTTGETATHKLREASAEWGVLENSVDVTGMTFDEAKAAISGAAHAQREQARESLRQRAAMQATRDATREAAQAFLDYSDAIVEGKFKLGDYLDQLEKQLRAQANFDQNIQTLAGRGVKQPVLDALIEQGPAAARAVEALANATDAQLRRFVRSMNQGRAGVRNFGKDTRAELASASDSFKSLPKDVRTKISTDGIPQTERQIDHLVEKYHLTEKQREALVTLKDLASSNINQVLALLTRFDNYNPTSVLTTIYRSVHEQGGGANQPGDTSGGAPGVRGRTGPSSILPNNSGINPTRDRFSSSTPRGARIEAAIAAQRGDTRHTVTINGGTQRIIVEVRGEMDLRRATAQIHELARGASSVEYEQRERFAESQRD